MDETDISKLLKQVSSNQANLLRALLTAADTNAELHGTIANYAVKFEPSKLTLASAQSFAHIRIGGSDLRAMRCQEPIAHSTLLPTIQVHHSHVEDFEAQAPLRTLHSSKVKTLPVLPAHMQFTGFFASPTDGNYISIDLAQAKEVRSETTSQYIHPSWESMTPTQPPAQELKYRFGCYYTSEGAQRELHSVDGKGIP